MDTGMSMMLGAWPRVLASEADVARDGEKRNAQRRQRQDQTMGVTAYYGCVYSDIVPGALL